MADHTENALRAVTKALTDVVAAAVDPKDPLANEQLRLVVDYVNFLRLRLDHLVTRARFDLKQAVEMASALAPLAVSAPAHIRNDLSTSIVRGRAALDEPGAPCVTLKTATTDLYGAIRRLVRAAATFEAAARREIEQAVVSASSAQILFERVWYAPLGLEPAAGGLPPLTHFLGSI